MLCFELMETVRGGEIALKLMVILLVLSKSIGLANGEGNAQNGKNKDWHGMVGGELRECSMCSPDKERCEECVRNQHCYHCFLRLARVYRPKPHVRGLSKQLSGKIIGGLSALLFMVLFCGPLCCLCCAVRRIRAIRATASSSRSLMFTVQWRSLNSFRPFKDDKEELGDGDRTWAAWEFAYTEIPDHLNGLSTAVFQSTLPILKPITSTNPLQEIRLNPGCCNRRREQSIQCRFPLAHILQHPNLLPNVSYFEITIIAFWRNEIRARSQGSLRGTVAIGLAARPAPPFRLPGKDPISVGYHSNRGKLFVSDFTDQGCRFGSRWDYVGATVGCGYDLDRRVVFFTHVGHNRGKPLFTEFGMGDGVVTPHLFPVIGADCDVTMLVNFGQEEFKFGPANLSRCSINQELSTLNQVAENLPEAVPAAKETAAIVQNGMTGQDDYNLVVRAHIPLSSEEAPLVAQSPGSPTEVSLIGQSSAASEEKGWEAPLPTGQTDA